MSTLLEAVKEFNSAPKTVEQAIVDRIKQYVRKRYSISDNSIVGLCPGDSSPSTGLWVLVVYEQVNSDEDYVLADAVWYVDFQEELAKAARRHLAVFRRGVIAR